MTLIRCKECGGDVSDTAEKCMKCGALTPRMLRREQWGKVLGVAVSVPLLLFVAGMCVLLSDSPTTTPATAGTSTMHMPANQARLLARFKEACETYDAQPNEIRKSEVFRSTGQFYSEVGTVAGFVGTIRRISTNQGGSRATIVIRAGTSDFYDGHVQIGSGVYQSAANLREGQTVFFSGGGLRDLNVTERGKVCAPDFSLTLSGLWAAR